MFAGFDKINKAEVSSRLKEILSMDGLMSRKAGMPEATGNDADAEAELDALAYAHYPKLSEADIKTLVVDDKWLTTLDAAIHGEMDRISQQLTQRVKQLAERYETPAPSNCEWAHWKPRSTTICKEWGLCGIDEKTITYGGCAGAYPPYLSGLSFKLFIYQKTSRLFSDSYQNLSRRVVSA